MNSKYALDEVVFPVRVARPSGPMASTPAPLTSDAAPRAEVRDDVERLVQIAGQIVSTIESWIHTIDVGLESLRDWDEIARGEGPSYERASHDAARLDAARWGIDPPPPESAPATNGRAPVSRVTFAGFE
ncbi:MAG: hypothetical protein B7Z69_01355 [Actinobacteria bacterium 21-73-9]|nr:MAG: hypothetical protein B7Z69_01355 [Actinobacteria bacterium 21-73-9]